MSLGNLQLLEQKIDGLLARHEKVHHEKTELLSRLSERDLEHTVLLDRLRQYEQERNEMRQLLERLMSRFEGLDLQ
ncbi:MAG: hypothetical protein EXR78_01765 [Deltaproteobacteria bacterium]|nr:hypothetical protein [Deltaproteobacteria bacterium]